jgi:outer membrane protein
MGIVQNAAGRSWRGVGALLWAASLVVLGSRPTAADPKSDFFDPDFFRTHPALKDRTHGLSDPLDRECPVPSGPVSLSVAIDLGLCRSPATHSAWAAARLQAAVLGSAESAWLPSIGATGGFSRQFGEHVDVTGETDTAPQNTRDAAVNLTWTLYDFGARGGRIRGAHSLLDAQAATLNSVSQQTVLQVVQSFYGVVAADASLIAAKTTETTAERSVEIARSLREGGVATQADVLQAQTAHDQAVLARIQADAAAKTARGSLAVAVGSPADQPLRLDADPVPAQVPVLTARMSDLMAEATRQRPDLAAALAQRDAAEANVTIARAAGRPSISIGAGHDWSNTTGVPNQNYNMIGVTVTVPIFTGFNVAYGVRQAQAQLEQSDASVEQVRLGVSLGVWNAYYALDSANQQLVATATLVKTAEQNQEVALGRYQSGVGTIIDVLTAQNGASTARQTRISAELSWEVARAQLALALGKLTGTEPLAEIETSP